MQIEEHIQVALLMKLGMQSQIVKLQEEDSVTVIMIKDILQDLIVLTLQINVLVFKQLINPLDSFLLIQI